VDAAGERRQVVDDAPARTLVESLRAAGAFGALAVVSLAVLWLACGLVAQLALGRAVL
jgi:hypothetical protein